MPEDGFRSSPVSTIGLCAETQNDLSTWQLNALQVTLSSPQHPVADLRKLTEMSLWSIGARTTSLPRGFPCLAIVKDSAGRYVFVNELWEKVFQKEPEDWYLKTDEELWDPAMARILSETDSEVIRNLCTRQTEVRVRANGTETHWLMARFPLQVVQGGTYLGCVSIDITERKLAEAALRDSENRYRDLFNSVLTGIYRTTPDGHILIANLAAARMFGYSAPEEFIQANAETFYFDSVERAQFIQDITRTGQVFGREIRLRRKDGSPLLARESAKIVYAPDGSIDYFEGVIEDITGLRRAEALERHRNAVLEMVARNESLSNIFHSLCRLVENHQPGTVCSVARVLDGKLYPCGGIGLPSAYLNLLSKGVSISPNAAFCGRAAYFGRSITLADLPNELAGRHEADVARECGFLSGCSVPILSGTHEVLGTFSVFRPVVHEPDGKELEFLVSLSHVAAVAIEHRQLYESLEFQANHDLLTQLANRSLFADRLEESLSLARQHQHRVSILWIDLDRFKEVNDSLGHRIGDLLIREVSNTLRSCIGPGETLARMGGDEFALLMPHIQDRDEAKHRAGRIVEAFRFPFQIEQYELFVTASIGICVFPDDGLDGTTLQRNADGAMYRAKASGRNIYVDYDPQIGSDAILRRELESYLRHAVELGELELFYQPQADMSGKVVAVEALLRWNHPKRGLLSPAEFIELAEETGLIQPIGKWIVKEACRQKSEWARQGFPDIRIAVNISPLQMYYGDLPEVVRTALEESGIPASALELELTESMMLRNFDESVRQMERLRALGITLAMDDFGTGYSSLSYLQRLPIDMLKLDQSFVSQIELSSSRAVVGAILTLAHTLGLHVVAEGVERRSQLEIVRNLGADFVQGFLISRPLPAHAVVKLFPATPSISLQ